ncbi:MAG: hypothetical protein ACRDHP_11385 [Ktedonobacterales bacterium]
MALNKQVPELHDLVSRAAEEYWKRHPDVLKPAPPLTNEEQAALQEEWAWYEREVMDPISHMTGNAIMSDSISQDRGE